MLAIAAMQLVSLGSCAAGLGLHAADVWQPVMPAIDDLLAWAQQPRAVGWRLLSTSLLVVYEGSAQSSQQVHAKCCLIDFAHSFLVDDGADDNFARGLVSLKNLVQSICAP